MTTAKLALLLAFLLIVATDAIANDNPDFRYLEPEGVALPRGSFGLGIVLEPNQRLAFLTGRTGSNSDGSYSGDFETQTRNALASVGILLSEAGMGWSDVVKINVYLTDSSDIPVWAKVRDEVIGESRPSGTGVIVKALANPARPMVAIVGGSKVSTKLTVLDALSGIVDQFAIAFRISFKIRLLHARYRPHPTASQNLRRVNCLFVNIERMSTNRRIRAAHVDLILIHLEIGDDAARFLSLIAKFRFNSIN